MVGTHLEDRLLDAVHDVEVATLDSGRDMFHTVYETVPTMMTDVTTMTDATFDFVGRMLALQLDAAHKVFGRTREYVVTPPTTHRTHSVSKAPAGRKASATSKAA